MADTTFDSRDDNLRPKLLPKAAAAAARAWELVVAKVSEVDPIGGTTGPSFLIGRLAGSVLFDHAT